ncbi:indole-3-acetate O-methyltransferase 1-like isoform X2 [Panicum virgatum]|uniref:indole-3-acetate O-methyltransferase 1-like isoform X2 n=1 Tax=Panicum virgatum TaxID=38727 RepID=UPI0019D6989D|nr:indole-3-acetate O-methyltransferase 1-like isoform X2 [Panicum virgatum]
MVATVKGVETQHEVVKNCFCMEGGQGETSYINNSQSRNLEMVVPALKETLDTIRLPRRPEKLLAAADLGCSCGQNTLVVADAIVQHMTDMYVSQGHDPPEFCIYFSDLPSNDFNTLFRLLLDRRYFGAGVPGSFHDRLFTERSIHAFTSTFSVHWLSRVPEQVLDKGSPAYNAGKVFVHGASEATGAAYRRQFQSDLARFLRCRAAELKRRGAMFLLCLGRPSSAAPTDQGRVRLLYGTLFEDSWADLVREGLMDGFNVPLYAPTLDEVREAVEAAGAFRINRLEMVTGSPAAVDHPDDPGAVGHTVANNVWSFVGALVDAHVGKALADELFGRLQRRAEERAGELMAEMRLPHVVCSLSLA